MRTSASPLSVINKAYEGTITTGISPVILDFNGDTGRNAVDGWITADGTGLEMTVAFSRDGVTYGDDWTMRSGENTGVRNFDIHSMRLTWTGDDVPYRVVLI